MGRRPGAGYVAPALRRRNDASKNRHATRHFHDTSHTIVASFEPGEEWRYCYVDEILV